MKVSHLVILAAIALFAAVHSLAETVYFLVADSPPTESYVLPLTDPNDIAYARDLIEYGPSIGPDIVVADVACGGDGINRDYVSSTKRAWNWHVTEFSGFADLTFEILDGRPSDLLRDCQGWITNTGGAIGFWSYTVVDELTMDLGHWQCDFIRDDDVNVEDLAFLAWHWLRNDCTAPDWCDGADINRNNIVDTTELAICSGAWESENPYAYEPYWFDAWNCPTQCHGDANCESEGGFMQPMRPVGEDDYTILISGAWPTPAYCYDGSGRYDPRADFDRDCDVDDDDVAIWEYWYGIPESEFPTDCPTVP